MSSSSSQHRTRPVVASSPFDAIALGASWRVARSADARRSLPRSRARGAGGPAPAPAPSGPAASRMGPTIAREEGGGVASAQRHRVVSLTGRGGSRRALPAPRRAGHSGRPRRRRRARGTRTSPLERRGRTGRSRSATPRGTTRARARSTSARPRRRARGGPPRASSSRNAPRRNARGRRRSGPRPRRRGPPPWTRSTSTRRTRNAWTRCTGARRRTRARRGRGNNASTFYILPPTGRAPTHGTRTRTRTRRRTFRRTSNGLRTVKRRRAPAPPRGPSAWTRRTRGAPRRRRRADAICATRDAPAKRAALRPLVSADDDERAATTSAATRTATDAEYDAAYAAESRERDRLRAKIAAARKEAARRSAEEERGGGERRKRVRR